MLSQIEREQANPTLAVTLRIAHAFGMDLGELVKVPNASSSLRVIRANDRTFHYRSDKYCRIRTLSPLNLEKDVGETTDVSAKHPDVVEKMTATLDSWRAACKRSHDGADYPQ